MRSLEACGCFPTGRHYPGIAHLLRIKAFGVIEELDGAGRWVELPIACIDTETTGRDPAIDRVIEVGIIIGVGGEVVRRFNWMIDPGVPISAEASAVHGITDEHVRGQKKFHEIAAEIAEALSGCVPTAYNAAFDRRFLHEEMKRAGHKTDAPAFRDGVEWLDPLVWARLIHAEEKSRALGEVAARLGIALENAHRASDDAEAALRVLYALGRDPRVPESYAGLVSEQRRLGRMQEDEMRIWRR